LSTTFAIENDVGLGGSVNAVDLIGPMNPTSAIVADKAARTIICYARAEIQKAIDLTASSCCERVIVAIENKAFEIESMILRPVTGQTRMIHHHLCSSKLLMPTRMLIICSESKSSMP
jgi:hypothetical protein